MVVGVGHVGSYVLADAMKTGLFAEIGVIDLLNNVAYGEALDQAQATSLTYMNHVDVTSGGYEQCADADVIIVAAGPSMIPDPNDPGAKPDRTLLTKTNCEVIREGNDWNNYLHQRGDHYTDYQSAGYHGLYCRERI